MEAIWYFRDKIDAWLREDDVGGSKSLEQIAEAVLRDLRLVSISLDEGDDAQVIFETLQWKSRRTSCYGPYSLFCAEEI